MSITKLTQTDLIEPGREVAQLTKINEVATVVNTITDTGTTVYATTLNTMGELSPAQITAQADDYNPTGLSSASLIHISSDAARSITGIVSNGSQGRHLWLFNVGSFNITLEYEHAGSTATNRFTGNGFADVVIASGHIAHLIYSGVHGRWMIVSYL